VAAALCVLDQQLNSDVFRPPKPRWQGQGPEYVQCVQGLESSALREGLTNADARLEPIRPRRTRAEALELLRRSRKHSDNRCRFQQESEWLARNESRYRGLWIALEGDQLLAKGETSKEVFSKVQDRLDPPLVIRIEEEQLPFGGW
jgi:hypothetical protein